MSYKYSKGPRQFDDITAETDADDDTTIDFEEDYIGFKTNGSLVLAVSGSTVGVNIDVPDSDTKLHVEGLSLLNGGVRNKTTSISANYTATTSDYVIGCDTSSNTITITLPAANATNVGLTYVIKDTGNAATNNITLDANASETIDGAATYVMSNNRESVTIINDGANGWFVTTTYVPI